MPSTKSISGDDDFLASSRKAEVGKCTHRHSDAPSTSGAHRPSLTVRALPHVPVVKRRRRSARAAFPFSLPRGQQLLLLDFPELRRELARRQRILLTQLALAIMSAGFGHNATARLLQVSSSRLCTWLQDYRRSGAAGVQPESRASRLSERNPCKISFHLAL